MRENLDLSNNSGNITRLSWYKHSAEAFLIMSDGYLVATSSSTSILDENYDLILCTNYENDLISSVCTEIISRQLGVGYPFNISEATDITMSASVNGHNKHCFVSIFPLTE